MAEQRRIAIVEDTNEDLLQMQEHLDRYAKEKNVSFHIDVYREGLSFLEEYRPVYDLILMDVEMPFQTGIDTARHLREMDDQVALIFVTRMAQYAVNGYEVSAMDFAVKPVSYGTLAEKLDRAFRRVDNSKRSNPAIILKTGNDSVQKIYLKNILYVTKDHNYILYVTKNGEIRVRGTLKEAEDACAGSSIVQCAKGCMVNLAHIEQKVHNDILIGDIRINITKPYQQAFTEAFMAFLRGTT